MARRKIFSHVNLMEDSNYASNVSSKYTYDQAIKLKYRDNPVLPASEEESKLFNTENPVANSLMLQMVRSYYPNNAIHQIAIRAYIDKVLPRIRQLSTYKQNKFAEKIQSFLVREYSMDDPDGRKGYEAANYLLNGLDDNLIRREFIESTEPIYNEYGYVWNGYYTFVNPKHPFHLCMTGQLPLTPENFELGVGPVSVWRGETIVDYMNAQGGNSNYQAMIDRVRYNTQGYDENERKVNGVKKEEADPGARGTWSIDKLRKAIISAGLEASGHSDVELASYGDYGISTLPEPVLKDLSNTLNLSVITGNPDHRYVTIPGIGFTPSGKAAGVAKRADAYHWELETLAILNQRAVDTLSRESDSNGRRTVEAMIQNLGNIPSFKTLERAYWIHESVHKLVDMQLMNIDSFQRFMLVVYNVDVQDPRNANLVSVGYKSYLTWLNHREDEFAKNSIWYSRSWHYGLHKEYYRLVYRLIYGTLGYVNISNACRRGLSRQQITRMAVNVFKLSAENIARVPDTRTICKFMEESALEGISDRVQVSKALSGDLTSQLLQQKKLVWLMDAIGMVYPYVETEGNRFTQIPEVMLPRSLSSLYDLYYAICNNQVVSGIGPFIYVAQSLGRSNMLPRFYPDRSKTIMCAAIKDIFDLVDLEPQGKMTSRLFDQKYQELFNRYVNNNNPVSIETIKKDLDDLELGRYLPPDTETNLLVEYIAEYIQNLRQRHLENKVVFWEVPRAYVKYAALLTVPEILGEYRVTLHTKLQQQMALDNIDFLFSNDNISKKEMLEEMDRALVIVRYIRSQSLI